MTTAIAEPNAAFLAIREELAAIREILQGKTEPPYLTPREAAAFARCCVRTLERRPAEAVGRVRHGGKVLYCRERLAEFLATSK